VQQTQITSKAEKPKPFTQAVFVNERSGWASTNKFLYATSDGGDQWRRLTFTAGEDSRISSFTFIDDSRGWLAVTKQTYAERYGMGNSSQIWATTDGGNTWNKQADFADEVHIREIIFLNADNGFAIGARTLDQPQNQGPPYDEILILKTVDGGRAWAEISDGARAEIKKQTGSTGDHGWDIASPVSTDLFLLTRNSALMQSSDEGKTWKTIARFKDQRPQGFVSSVAFFKLVFDTEQRIRIIAGAQGDEGYWGDFVTRADDASWASYELNLMPILDAKFLSKNEIVACGLEVRTGLPVVGLILHSLDGGKSWERVYRSRISEAFFSLTKFGERKFYAVSDAGTVLKFDLR
jgi:photosystem II stability/assembly factor-like uncharacterized protein